MFRLATSLFEATRRIIAYVSFHGFAATDKYHPVRNETVADLKAEKAF
jgi:hypothetical protein